MKNRIVIGIISLLIIISMTGNIFLYNTNNKLHKFADSSAKEIESLNNSITEKDSELQTIQSNNDELETTIADLQSQTEELQALIEDLKSENEELKAKIEELENAKTEVKTPSNNSGSNSNGGTSQPSQSEQQALEDALSSLGWTESGDVVIGSGDTGGVPEGNYGGVQ
ncbi:MAG: hypothetical protein ACI39N_03875 [Lachnospiraceae bacterium]